jgi:hypothetical protein
MCSGSAIASSSGSDGKDSQRSMTHGKMPTTSTPTLDLNSYRMEMTILTLRRISTKDTQMPLGIMTPLQLMHDLSDDEGLIDRSARMLTLGGGYCDNIANPDAWHIGIYPQDLGLHSPTLAC